MSTSKPVASSSPNVNISSQCHLDPVSYVKGDHLLTLENYVLVHPRSKLFTDAGPISIREASIISEKCTIGTLSGSDPGVLHRGAQGSSSKSIPSSVINTDQSTTQSALPITIGRSVYVHPNVNVQPPSTIADFAILEAGVTIMPGCTVNAHSKICAGVTLPTGTTVPSWSVVYGIDGRMRRSRHKDLSEEARLEAMNRERVTATNLLRANASVNKLANPSSAGVSRDKRQSVILGEGQKP